jgi:hypothetical protein
MDASAKREAAQNAERRTHGWFKDSADRGRAGDRQHGVRVVVIKRMKHFHRHAHLTLLCFSNALR